MGGPSQRVCPDAQQLRLELLEHWQRIAHLSPAELYGRIVLAQSILNGDRFRDDDPDVLLVQRALDGWSLEELAAGARRG